MIIRDILNLKGGASFSIAPDRLLGVISFHDVAKAAIKEASFGNRLLKRYIEHQPPAGRLAAAAET